MSDQWHTIQEVFIRHFPAEHKLVLETLGMAGHDCRDVHHILADLCLSMVF